MRYLGLAQVVELHERILAATGGAPGLRDLGALESALAQPKAAFAGRDLHQTLAEKAAALCFSLAQNHPFVDGNKPRRPRGDGDVPDSERVGTAGRRRRAGAPNALLGQRTGNARITGRVASRARSRSAVARAVQRPGDELPAAREPTTPRPAAGRVPRACRPGRRPSEGARHPKWRPAGEDQPAPSACWAKRAGRRHR